MTRRQAATNSARPCPPRAVRHLPAIKKNRMSTMADARSNHTTVGIRPGTECERTYCCGTALSNSPASVTSILIPQLFSGPPPVISLIRHWNMVPPSIWCARPLESPPRETCAGRYPSCSPFERTTLIAPASTGFFGSRSRIRRSPIEQCPTIRWRWDPSSFWCVTPAILVKNDLEAWSAVSGAFPSSRCGRLAFSILLRQFLQVTADWSVTESPFRPHSVSAFSFRR